MNLISSVPVPLVMVCAAGKICRFTPAAASAFNLCPGDVGRCIGEITPSAGLAEIVSDVVVSRTLKEMEIKDWGGVWYKIRAAPYLSKRGEVGGATIALVEIDEVKRLRTELKLALDGIAGANRVKDDFLAVLSHELRTPLTTVLGWTQELRSTGNLPPAVDEALVVIERSATAQGQLINDLLDISRIQAGKLSIEVRVMDVGEALGHAVTAARTLAEKKSISLEVEIIPEVCMIFADAMRIQQIFWNILTNALKFTPDAGRVQVRLDVAICGDEKFARIQIVDSGMGITRDFLPRIFERFTQGDSSMTRNHGGLGLGLALVKSLVEMQDGIVTAASPGEGKGATFTVLLPLVPQENIPLRGPLLANEAAPVSIQLDGVKVLVVDDDPCNLELFAVMLKSCAMDVRLTDSAAGALQAVQTYRPDVLISDIAMPVEDGYTLIHKVRLLDAAVGGSIPAIALTAYASADDVRRVLTAGFSAHVAKPVNKIMLLQTIAKLLRQPGCYH